MSIHKFKLNGRLSLWLGVLFLVCFTPVIKARSRHYTKCNLTRIHLGDVGTLSGRYFMGRLVEEIGCFEAQSLQIICIGGGLVWAAQFQVGQGGGEVEGVLFLLREEGPREVTGQHLALLDRNAAGSVVECFFGIVQAWSSAFVDDLPASHFFGYLVEQVVFFLLDVAATAVPLDWRVICTRSWHFYLLWVIKQISAYGSGQLWFYFRKRGPFGGDEEIETSTAGGWFIASFTGFDM